MKTKMLILAIGLALSLMTSEIMAQCAGGRCCSGGSCYRGYSAMTWGGWRPGAYGWWYRETPVTTAPTPAPLTTEEESELEAVTSPAPEPEPAECGTEGPCGETCPAPEVADAVPVLTIPTFRERALARINQYRASAGLPPLELDESLCQACSNHCVHMASWGFAHDPYGGREVIAMGVSTPEGAVSLWLNSPSHAGILRGHGRKIGIGWHGSFWTVRVR